MIRGNIMNKIKDLIYDKSDIIVALLILAIAALVILWRLNVILEYPKALVGTDEPNTVLTGTDYEAEGEGEGASDNTVEGEDTEEPENTTVETPEPVMELWVDGQLTKDVEVTVGGNSATAAVQCLIDEKLFDSYDDYKSICDKGGLDHEKVSAGTFTFKAGSTKSDIAKRINWGS